MSQSPAQALRQHALRLLARREHTRSELGAKLSRKFGADDAVRATLTFDVDTLLDDLEARGLLSDQRFAVSRVAYRARRLGNSRIAHELKTQGVDRAIIASVMEDAGDELARARAVRQGKFGALPTGRDEWVKQARFLQSRGFASEVVRQALKNPEIDTD